MNTTKGAKSPKKPTAKLPRAKKPKPAVYFCDSPSGIYLDLTTYKQTERHYTVAVIPTHTAAQARQIVKAAKFLQLSEGEKVERIAYALMYSECGDNPLLYSSNARAVLAAMGTGGGK